MKRKSITEVVSTSLYKFFLRNGLDIRRTSVISEGESEIIFSYNEEQKLIAEILSKLGVSQGFVVDIAASDGVTISNTYALFRGGWDGLAVEYNTTAFTSLANNYSMLHQVALAKCLVTPINVVSLLAAYSVPTNFDFMNLDVDGYDYFILEQVLTKYRPKLICAEINEKIPPPLEFTVKWSPDYHWDTSHFYGQSISKLASLAIANDYVLVDLHYNNALLVPKELWHRPCLTAEEAYNSGYRNKTDREVKFPWNRDMEDLLGMAPEAAIQALRERFRKYEGLYEISL